MRRLKIGRSLFLKNPTLRRSREKIPRSRLSIKAALRLAFHSIFCFTLRLGSLFFFPCWHNPLIGWVPRRSFWRRCVRWFFMYTFCGLFSWLSACTPLTFLCGCWLLWFLLFLAWMRTAILVGEIGSSAPAFGYVEDGDKVIYTIL